MTTPQGAAQPPVAERTGHPFLTHDMIFEIPDTIRKTVEVSSTRVGALVERLKDRTNFFFTGCGTAFFSAMLGGNVLSLMQDGNFNFEAVQALELSNYHRIPEHTVTFGLSHSGITKTTLDALRTSKTKGGYTIGITHFADSPITKVADETLVVGNGPDLSRCHTKCYLAGALALTATGIEILEQRRAAPTDRLHEIQNELTRLPQFAEKVLTSTEGAMKKLAEQATDERTIYFAGTGASYPNALEAALKIMETSYVPSQGFETEQLLHGPWVSLDDRSILFVMATEDHTHGRNVDLIKAATNLGSTVIPIVQEGDRAISGAYENAIEIPPVDEQLSPYLTIIPLYLFAYYASLIRGYNPDYLRYLTPRYWETRTIIFPPGTH